ncbi:hypothetical protein E2C01_061497 [Portunus trituberculatus]|uniref:RNase H type-1 domain-containing protein n=1 Tax=Portunus trituberculatus TaxID=210409 RepID=A0A5B7HB41_PORTR|nr:hypothetical protein [Portunus trituberculatus]
MVLDTFRARVFPSPDQANHFHAVARQFLLAKAPLVSLWRFLLGHLASLARLVPGGHLQMWALQWCLKRHWRAVSDSDWWWVAPNRQYLQDLAWWLVPEHTLFSDASQLGWRAHLGDTLALGIWTVEEQELHMNYLELLAVFRALQSFEQALSESVVSVMSNNSTVVAYLRKSGGTRSEPLSTLSETVLRWCESRSISLCPVFIPGCRNVIVDVLSWECVSSEWTLHPKICRKVFKVWQSPLVIRRAYVSVSEEESCLLKVNAFEVRAIATSVLFRKVKSLDLVLKVGTWKSMTTFASFYLRDVTHRYLDTFSLGPIVSAPRVVH